MTRERLPWALGWVSLGIGVTELMCPERIARVLGAPRRSGWVRVLGLRGLATGVGLLLQPHQRPWLWARVAGDVLDLALLAVSFRLPRAHRAWQGALTAATAGMALVDLSAAIADRGRPPLRSGTVEPSPSMGAGSNVPAESWRGSGLAEDVGLGRRQDDAVESDEAKQRMMRDAARELGLPE